LHNITYLERQLLRYSKKCRSKLAALTKNYAKIVDFWLYLRSVGRAIGTVLHLSPFVVVVCNVNYYG